MHKLQFSVVVSLDHSLFLSLFLTLRNSKKEEEEKKKVELNFRSLTFMILIAFFVWCSSIETCIARRGKHWRQSRYAAALSKKKGGSHGHRNYHNGGSKPKPPPSQSHKATPSPKPKEEVPPPFNSFTPRRLRL
ncbi:hypothetical protein GOBAR_DD17585 [Gossypium barbadense]|nr:hypothetical protein GOBAR_DD17585 [Gossypium barbadense]